METGNVVVVLRNVLEIGYMLPDLFSLRYRMSQEWKDLEHQVNQLRREQTFWEKKILEFGLSADQDLLELFGRAKYVLAEETRALSQRKRKWDEYSTGGFLSKLMTKIFPAHLERSVGRVRQVFNEVLDGLRRRTDIERALRGKTLQENLQALGFHKDRRYVRLSETDTKVMAALKNPDSPSVVLLHGFPGAGKSSLARDVALQLAEASDQRHSQHAGSLRDNGLEGLPNLSVTDELSTEMSPARSLVFEQVIFLECGPQVDLQSKQLGLRDTLGWSAVPLEGREGDLRSQTDTPVTNVLAKLLEKRPLLIILDDVWKSNFDNFSGQGTTSNFLQKMIDLGGKNVKWLVTSRERELCSDLNCEFVSISMEKIKPEVARQILTLHIGLSEDNIPEEGKMYMDRLIQKVDSNPLAMTCVAPAIDRTRFEDQREWEAAIEDLANLLDRKAATPIQSKEHGQSFWEAIQVGFDLLTKQLQNLLVLMVMCKGPSVPEEIIQFLFLHLKDPASYCNFSQARRDLESRQLIKIDTFSDRWGKKEMRWSIHALIKDFIIKQYNFFSEDDNISVIERLSNAGIPFRPRPEDESEVLITVAALYFDDKFRCEFAQQSSVQMSIPAGTLSDVRRRVIEPVSRLLVLTENVKWTSDLYYSTRQVFLTYVRGGQFNEGCTTKLLDSLESAVPMIDALTQLGRTDEYSFVGPNVISFLVRLLETATSSIWDTRRRKEEIDGHLLIYVSLAICDLLKNNRYESSRKLLRGVRFREAFTHLVKLFLDTDHVHNSRMQEPIVQAIANLAYSCVAISSELAEIPGLLDGLITAFLEWQDDNYDIQAHVVAALGSLAFAVESVNLQLIQRPGMLRTLVKALKIKDHHKLQRWTAALFQVLSLSYEAGLKIVNCSCTLREIVNGLGEDSNKSFQEACANTIKNLAYLGDDMKMKLIEFPDLMQELVGAHALVKDDVSNFALRKTAGTTLVNLAMGDERIRWQMLKFRGLLEKLDDAVNKDDGSAIRVLTFLNPPIGKARHLSSAVAYSKRGGSEAQLNLYQEALEDLDEACRLGPPDEYTFSWRCLVKARTSDFQGALADANSAVEMKRTYFTLLERGVLKRMMGDLPGAQADLDESLELSEDLPIFKYEILKHRGLVKSLRGNEDEARADGLEAIKSKCCQVDASRYGSFSLGEGSVKYLEFQLR